ncbi:hypothetical protein [Erythrobacter sp. YT30]|uniref:hypothetical protein n=1 Tax=Erythrobacter sp. YT30 TaxID=1735012 RepID=UPI00076C6F72|nr:hypothetical protein [Erythrobacter sp. YT30]KWV90986.1 hypothetical protein AUC45_06545 [Erythrobacter sp. YT30]
MKVTTKTWTTLGLATALAGAGLAGCSGEAGSSGEGGEAAQSGESGAGGEGEGGEGAGGEGEGAGGEGEGGVSVGAAGTDPVVYRSALAIAEAHVIAARDAFAAGNTEAAAEMFGHPVSEVLADLDPVFEELGVEDMKPMFNAASQGVLNGEDAAKVNERADEIIAALRAAAAKAPDDGTSAAMIAAGVASDQIERAADMYGEAVEGKIYGPYLDGYGFYKSAEAAFDGSSDAIAAENADLAGKITAALGLLGKAYLSAELPENLDANQGELQGASSAVMLATS